MCIRDSGRVVSNFICQGLLGNEITIYGDGSQTRSFCYVDDLIDGMMLLMQSSESGPINIGNPNEFTIMELAKLITNKIDRNLNFVYKPLPEDDPTQRRPVIDKARKKLNWKPKIELNEGLDKTIDYFRDLLSAKL